MEELQQAGVELRERADARAQPREGALRGGASSSRSAASSASPWTTWRPPAGVGKGTLFRRFGDRAGLARAVLDESERAFQDDVAARRPPARPRRVAVRADRRFRRAAARPPRNAPAAAARGASPARPARATATRSTRPTAPTSSCCSARRCPGGRRVHRRRPAELALGGLLHLHRARSAASRSTRSRPGFRILVETLL